MQWRIYWQYNEDAVSIEHNSGDITTECVAGHVSCFDDSSYQGSMLGFYEACSETTDKIGGLDANELDLTSNLPTFDARKSLMDPKESEIDFVQYIKFSTIAERDDEEDDSSDSTTKKNKNKKQHALNSSTTHQSTKVIHTMMVIFPLIMMAMYILWTRCISRDKNTHTQYKYTMLSTIETHANYGTISQ